MLTECFNIRICFPRKPRKIQPINTFVAPIKVIVHPPECPPSAPKRKRPRGQSRHRNSAFLQALANGTE
ncbi:unnamed protein product [Allacma fusca]|uniref:Uncharacterized protein n=1 Tax=Allacma fusca TaxID=39272 RepID=A0A8J2L4D5_9HEXA|nr:unnamed protein product [Allacma fusca]